ncbi:MAG: permease [Firmicutes bacterium]|nr:permease [Bacillota bacterium]
METISLGVALALTGAALAMILAGIGSVHGVCKIGSASSALLAKEPKHFSKLLILMLLPSSQSIYALTVSFMVFVRLGLLPGADFMPINTDAGLAILFLCLPVGVIGGISASLQGSVGVNCVSMYAKQNKLFGNSILVISASEVFALFGFLISMLGVLFLNLDYSLVVPYVESAPAVEGAVACISSYITAVC